MATTIQVSETTKQLLQMAKEEEGAQSYDALIREVFMQKSGIPKSLFGKGKGAGWKKVDRMKFSGE